MSRILTAGPLLEKIHAGLAEQVGYWLKQGIQPRLDVLLCEENGSCSVYANALEKKAGKSGIAVYRHAFPSSIDEKDFRQRLWEIGSDPEVHAVLPLLPLPAHIRCEAVTDVIPPEKDVDAVSPQTLGLFFVGHPTFIPSTARAVDRLLEYYAIPLQSKQVVVIGRSPSAGRAIAWQCLSRDATVTICHRKTLDLARIASTADILICATGQAALVEATFIKPGAVVIDVGMNVVGDRLVGDVCFDQVEPLVEAITPVPGGVGPITTAVLLEATLEATSLAERGGHSERNHTSRDEVK